jgi:hypothetical protein
VTKKKNPTATRVSQYPSWTSWRINFPSTPKKDGATYWATTYPNSDLVYVTTGAKRRPISKNVGRKLIPTIKAAIDAAIKAELPLHQKAAGFAVDEAVAQAALAKIAEMTTGAGIAVNLSRPAIVDSGLRAMFDAVPPVGDIDGFGMEGGDK